MNLPDVRTVQLVGKTVFLRGDLDVPLRESGEIDDDSRLRAGLPTVRYILEHCSKVIIGGHLGRPGGKIDKSLSLYPIAQWFSKSIIHNSSFIIQDEKIGDFDGWELSENLFLLENLRFYPGEESNPSTSSGQVFAERLASLADIYVNDAFSVSHRDHASITGIPKVLPHYAGIRLQEEISSLSKVLGNPQRPFIVIIGGKKLETKLPLVKKMIEFADYVLVGGLIAKEIEENHPIYSAKIKLGRQNSDATDIEPVSIEEFVRIIKTAKTVIWNGSMGRIGPKGETLSSEIGTENIAKAIIESGAFSVVGGGDSVEYLQKIGVIDKFDFVSMGGGAMLSFLAGEKLPGIEALLK